MPANVGPSLLIVVTAAQAYFVHTFTPCNARVQVGGGWSGPVLQEAWVMGSTSAAAQHLHQQSMSQAASAYDASSSAYRDGGSAAGIGGQQQQQRADGPLGQGSANGGGLPGSVHMRSSSVGRGGGDVGGGGGQVLSLQAGLSPSTEYSWCGRWVWSLEGVGDGCGTW